MFAMVASHLRSIFGSQRGQALMEYALILVLISAISVLALTGIGVQINDLFDTVIPLGA